MSRTILILTVLHCVLAVVAFAYDIPAEDIEVTGVPCSCSIEEVGSTRTIYWDTITGADFYAVGRVPNGGSLATLTNTTNLSYDDTTWSSAICYDYYVVAYDTNNDKICAAVVHSGSCLH